MPGCSEGLAAGSSSLKEQTGLESLRVQGFSGFCLGLRVFGFGGFGFWGFEGSGFEVRGFAMLVSGPVFRYRRQQRHESQGSEFRV